MYDNFGLAEHCKKWLQYPTRYGWGCWGQPVSESIITAKTRQYPDHYDRARQAELRRLIGKAWLIDCVGLIKNYYWGMTPGGSEVEYQLKTDVSADDMYYRASSKGVMRNMPDLPGICVQLPGHIGVYIGDGKVIESTRGIFGDGVVTTDLAARKWVHWLQCPFIDYKAKEEEEVNLEEFKRLYTEMLAEPKGDKPTDWAEESCEKAKASGIIGGDGEGNYNWQDPVSREALASILHRAKLI